MDHPLSKTGIVSSALALKELTLYTLIFVCIIFRAASMYVCIYVCVRKESRNFGQLSECVHLMYEVTRPHFKTLKSFAILKVCYCSQIHISPFSLTSLAARKTVLLAR